MRINIVPTVISIALSLLISFSFYSYYEGDNRFLLTWGSFILLAATLIMAIGVRFELPRTTVNVRMTSGIFFTIALASNIIFSFQDFSTPSYIIINGILFLIFILISYSINKAKQ